MSYNKRLICIAKSIDRLILPTTPYISHFVNPPLFAKLGIFKKTTRKTGKPDWVNSGKLLCFLG
jgi:hypothetical protein